MNNRFFIFLFLVFSLFIGCKDNILKVSEFNEAEVELSSSGETDPDLRFVEDLSIPIPSNIVVSKGNFKDKIEISWNPVVFDREKLKYEIYRSENISEDYVKLNNTLLDDPSFIDYSEGSSLVPGKTYFYRVKALSLEQEKISKFSAAADGFLLGDVKKFVVTQRAFKDKVAMTWEPVDGALYYTIYRAESLSDGSAPKLVQQYDLISDSIVGTSFYDYSTEAKGDLISQKEYWYLLAAHFDNNTYKFIDNPVKGSLEVVGAPKQTEIVYVSKGVFSDAIKVVWKQFNATSFVLYKVSSSQIEAGNYYGDEIYLSLDDLGSQDIIVDGETITCQYYYDSSSDVSTGEDYYYRVAGINSIGPGRSSDLNLDDLDFFRGSGISPYEGAPVDVRVTKDGFFIEWEECKGAKGYYVYRSSTEPASNMDSSFEKISYVTGLSFLDSESNIKADIPDFILESDELFYKVKPAYELFVDDDGVVINGANEIFGDITLNSLIAEYLSIFGKEPIVYQSGDSGFDGDYTVPMPVFDIAPVASQNDPNHAGYIVLSGKLSDTSNLDNLNFKLVRICRYGYEDGVHPLFEPRKTIGGVSFTKVGVPHVESILEINLNDDVYLNAATGEFTYVDPMYAFENGQLIPDSSEPDGYKKQRWLYADWDTEAWKDIKRKRPFNMQRAMNVEYKVVVERKSDATWSPLVGETVGWPALTEFQFAHMAMWFKDVAMNRLSLILIPRYHYAMTLAWLAGGNSQSIQGEYNEYSGSNGRAYLSVWKDGLGGAGSGGIENYCDWPGMVIETKDNNGNNSPISMAVKLESNVTRNVSQWVTIQTPYYSGSMYYSVFVRDYNYHWGLDRREDGTVDVYFRGSKTSFAPGLILPKNSEDKNGGPLGRVAFDSGTDPFPTSGDYSWNCNFTRINFKYRSVPVNHDFGTEEHPVMRYGYQYE
ncbi:MAG: fibronectin type III domain-containing protein [Spirochaetales bacterium]|nr:fibronectin type III domain-containing protein [Spirochaetales bacterium]